MAEKQRYFRLGVFVLVSLALSCITLFLLGGRALFEPTLTFETYFDQSVSGLDVGAKVEFRGVPIGQVTEIVMSSPLYEQNVPVDKRRAYIVVRAKVTGNPAQVKQWQQDLPEFVKRGLRAQTQLAGVTGQQILALNQVDPKRYPTLAFDWKPDYPYVPSVPSLTGQIITTVQKFMAGLSESDLQGLSHNLNRLVETLTDKIGQVPVSELSAEAAGMLQDGRSAIQRVERILTAAPIDQAVGNLSSAAGRIDTLLNDPSIGQALRSIANASAQLNNLLARQVQKTLNNVVVFTARLRRIAETGELDRLVAHLDQTVQRLDALVGANQYDVRGIVQDLQATAANLRNLSEVAKRYPAGVLFGGPPAKSDMPWKEVK
ncbi:MAG: MCE family protein [Gammaproteobacteria bacterium]|nr:MCE family protein [Gammaproteobacteria bacterium]MCP5458299.1 MCE family protein [Gammaproteobacteria bacterium]